MRQKLKLVVSNTNVDEKIIASIRPLAREVGPSQGFREGMKLRLLKLESLPAARSSQAA